MELDIDLVPWQVHKEKWAFEVHERTAIVLLILWTMRLMKAQMRNCAEDRRHQKPRIHPLLHLINIPAKRWRIKNVFADFNHYRMDPWIKFLKFKICFTFSFLGIFIINNDNLFLKA